MRNLNLQKGFSPIIAVILLAVILIGGGAYYFKQQAKQASKSNTSSSTWVNPFESSSIKWKTFSIKDIANSDDHYIKFSTAIEQIFSIPMYGIQFSLPPVTKGNIMNNYNPSKFPIIDFTKNKKLTTCSQYASYYQDNNPVTAYETEIEISVPIAKITNAKEWFDACEKPITYSKGIPTTETSIINGNNILIIKATPSYYYDRYIFVKNSIIYIFNFDNREATSETLQQVQQMLDSIKFSQPTIKLP